MPIRKFHRLDLTPRPRTFLMQLPVSGHTRLIEATPDGLVMHSAPNKPPVRKDERDAAFVVARNAFASFLDGLTAWGRAMKEHAPRRRLLGLTYRNARVTIDGKDFGAVESLNYE